MLKLKDDLKHLRFKKITEKILNNIKTKKYKEKFVSNAKNDKEYEIYNDNTKKIAIYTCITGNYDNIYEPIIKEKKCDYILFTNNSNLKSDKYKVMDIPEYILENNKDNILINRYIKMHPFELFKDKYDYTIYLDGNIRVISNVSSFVNCVSSKYGIAMHKHSIRNCIFKEEEVLKLLHKGNKEKIREQLNNYKSEGFPTEYGMLEANVIVTDIKNQKSKDIINDWWNEFIKSGSFRDQLSLPYVLWKNNIKVEEIATLGNNVYDNPKIEVESHK